MGHNLPIPLDERNGAGQSRPEKEITTNGEESQTEILRPHFKHTSLEKGITLGTMPGLRRQGGQQKEWSDALEEWTAKTVPDLVRKAEDQSAFERFIYEVAHVCASSMAP